MMLLRSLLILVITLSNLSAGSLPNDHAPIGVMGEHVHKSGEWMLSYRNMQMNMEDLYIDDSKISTDRALDDYMMSPTKMKKESHMFGIMHAISDNVTLMVGGQYIYNDMTMVNRSKVSSYMESSGVSDISLTSLHDITDKNYLPGNTILQVGISLPTGSITEEADGVRLPYKMQLGSGTVDPIIKIVNRLYWGQYVLGSQISSILRFGHNDENYRLGNEYSANIWLDRNLCENISASIRLAAVSQGQISGVDSEIEGMTSSLRDAQMQNGDWVNLGVGVNYIIDQIKGLRLAAEYSLPIYQNLNGPSLGMSDSYTIGIQYTLNH